MKGMFTGMRMKMPIGMVRAKAAVMPIKRMALTTRTNTPMVTFTVKAAAMAAQ
ncbi:hypothetical protein IQ285_28685 [Burkholderia sp. R-69608]|uniref:hypothetical protein n=1 Tax=Paraburkholderia nemoris TaxID=2793076 RepID=UPI001911ED7D|nr:hypothetical protein [Paraburkholderia nemoris]MBK5151675.1 hypothetical protein [Burkholderia sp. R-69608]